jgi:hypothetical protein
MAIVGRGMKCCGSMPRCRACPVRLSAELARIEGKTPPEPAHLVGVPACLHKYEPLFRRAAEQGATQLPVSR